MPEVLPHHNIFAWPAFRACEESKGVLDVIVCLYHREFYALKYNVFHQS